jgi:hypothetical protein
MPSKSKSQQRLFGMVRACQKTGNCASPEVEKIADSMTKKDAKEFAKTNHKGLPNKAKKRKKVKKFSEWIDEKNEAFDDFSLDKSKAGQAEKLWQPMHITEFPCLGKEDKYYLLRGRLEQLYFEMGKGDESIPANHLQGMVDFYNKVVDEFVRTRHPDLYQTWRYINDMD